MPRSHTRYSSLLRNRYHPVWRREHLGSVHDGGRMHDDGGLHGAFHPLLRSNLSVTTDLTSNRYCWSRMLGTVTAVNEIVTISAKSSTDLKNKKIMFQFSFALCDYCAAISIHTNDQIQCEKFLLYSFPAIVPSIVQWHWMRTTTTQHVLRISLLFSSLLPKSHSLLVRK